MKKENYLSPKIYVRTLQPHAALLQSSISEVSGNALGSGCSNSVSTYDYDTTGASAGGGGSSNSGGIYDYDGSSIGAGGGGSGNSGSIW